MKKTSLALFVATLISTVPFAKGAEQLAPNRVSTNLAGATTALAPPSGFSPLTASDEELAAYGFPPRPDSNAAPKAYAKWQKVMTASKFRIVPVLEQTSIKHGPMKKAGVQNASAVSESTATSSNWSAAVNLSGAKSYNNTSTFYYVDSEYVVPVANQAFGSCTGTWDFSSSWVGIDGYGTGDVLQAGTESDAYCNGSSKSTFYSAWYEWYPYSEVRISSLPVAPGDDMFVEVWHTSATQGYAYVLNMNTNQYVDIGFTAPSGTSLVGNSAEFVVERPGLSTGLATLTNYVMDFFTDCFGVTENNTTYDPGVSSTIFVTMVDSNGNGLSYPALLNSNSLLFRDEGTAY